MRPEYILQLADSVDPDKLWRLSGLDQDKLSEAQRAQLDAGVALRRHAAHMRRLYDLAGTRRALLITPVTTHHFAITTADVPPEHQHLFDRKG